MPLWPEAVRFAGSAALSSIEVSSAAFWSAVASVMSQATLPVALSSAMRWASTVAT